VKKKIRKIICALIAYLLILSGIAKKNRSKALNGDFILSIYFHSPSKKLFEFCINWLIRNNFTFLTQGDIIDISESKLEFPKGAVIVTVDDGWQSNVDNIAAIAEKYNVPVTIFVSTEPVINGNYWWPYVSYATKAKITTHTVESLKKLPNSIREGIVTGIREKIHLQRQAMTVNELKTIANSNFVSIGGHTVTHPILPNCDNKIVYDELKNSKQIIESWINKEVDSFAYPNGDYNLREINYLMELGYKVAYTTKADHLTKQAIGHIYELPRFCVFENVSEPEAICRMLGVWQQYF
jgi:peptidoglycan/xylan/chitin deacetylase (PgdA/CDA1 family)